MGNQFIRVRNWISAQLSPLLNTIGVGLAKSVTIEFVGGPLDGYRETVAADYVARMPTKLELPISLALFDYLDGDQPRGGFHPTSIATYDLMHVGKRWRFQLRHQRAAGSASHHQSLNREQHGH